MLAVEFFGDAVFSPREIEQCDGAVVEEIEEFAEGVVFILLVGAFDDQRGVVVREDAGGSGESHKGDGHFRGFVVFGLKRGDFAVWEASGWQDTKAYGIEAR